MNFCFRKISIRSLKQVLNGQSKRNLSLDLIFYLDNCVAKPIFFLFNYRIHTIHYVRRINHAFLSILFNIDV